MKKYIFTYSSVLGGHAVLWGSYMRGGILTANDEDSHTLSVHPFLFPVIFFYPVSPLPSFSFLPCS